jgi:two-component system sensor histidine kinase UhpB
MSAEQMLALRREGLSDAWGGGGSGMSLRTRVFLMVCVVLAGAALLLLLTPATVSSPVLLAEIVVLVVGVSVVLFVIHVFLVRAFAPLVRLADLMRTIDLLQPGRRVPVSSSEAEVAELARAFNDMLGRLEEERRQSASNALGAQEAERRRVAQELHDEIGQSLTAVVLQLGRMERTAPAELRPELAEARETARASLEEVRQIAQRLRPEALDELGLESALVALADRVAERGGLRVVTRIAGRLPELGPMAELVVYRVAQEALTNTLRHARATHAVLTLRSDAESVVLSVKDDGRGLDGSSPGAGIQGMRERAMLVNARIAIVERAEGGTEVRLEIPAETE